MSSQPWRDALWLGHAPMDRAHGTLAALVDEVELAVRRGEDPGEVQGLLLRLVEETSDHFSEEHELMLASGYPGREAHIEDHDRLLSQLSELLSSHSTGEQRMTVKLAGSLRAWLVIHIQGPDRALADYVRARGASG